MEEFKKVLCPYCGYSNPVMYNPATAICRGVTIRCKGKHCKKLFEIKINMSK